MSSRFRDKIFVLTYTSTLTYEFYVYIKEFRYPQIGEKRMFALIVNFTEISNASVTCERKGTERIQVHKVTGGAMVSASVQNVDELGSISTDHQFFDLDLLAGMPYHLPTSIIQTLRLIVTQVLANFNIKFFIVL